MIILIAVIVFIVKECTSDTKKQPTYNYNIPQQEYATTENNIDTNQKVSTVDSTITSIDSTAIPLESLFKNEDSIQISNNSEIVIKEDLSNVQNIAPIKKEEEVNTKSNIPEESTISKRTIENEEKSTSTSKSNYFGYFENDFPADDYTVVDNSIYYKSSECRVTSVAPVERN